MENITRRLEQSIENGPLKNKEKYKKQQEYYQRLNKSGIAKKQTYTLKSVSAI